MALEKAVVDEVEHGGEQRQCAAGHRHPETPVEVHVGGRQPINVERQLRLGAVSRPRPASEHRHGRRLHAEREKQNSAECSDGAGTFSAATELYLWEDHRQKDQSYTDKVQDLRDEVPH